MKKRGNRFSPGQVVAFGHTKRGQELVIRTLRMSDVAVLRKFINTVIAEDTYVATSSPKSTKEETAFVRGRLKDLHDQDGVYLMAWVGKTLAAVCGIERRGSSTRTCHRGRLGITVAKKFRNQGIGRQLGLAAVDAAKRGVPGLKIIELEVFAINPSAITLYKKLGFKQYGRLPRGLIYKGNHADELFMYKTV